MILYRWNRVIETAPMIMKKFVLNVPVNYIYPRICEKSKELMSLERNFTRVWISTDEEVGDRLMDVVKKFGKKVVDLCLYFNQSEFLGVWNPPLTLNVLQHVSQLEKLTLVFHERLCREDLPPKVDVDSVALLKLKKLEFRGNCDVFALVKAPQLTHLTSRHEELPYYQLFDFGNFEKLLKASSKLICLKTHFNVFNKLNPGFPFQLKKIVALGSFELTDQIMKFLLSQAATVETFEGECDDSELHKLVLTEFKRLRTVKTNLDKLTASPDFYSNLEPMPLLQEILSFSGFSSESAMQAVLGKCPNLVKLVCTEDSDLSNRLTFIAKHSKRLQVLGVSVIRETNAEFQCLEELIVATVGQTNNLISFLKLNPSIETLEIQLLSYSDLLTVDVSSIITETKIKRLNLSGCKSGMEKVYNEIQSKLGSWTTLKLSDEYPESLQIDINRESRPRGTKRKHSCPIQ